MCEQGRHMGVVPYDRSLSALRTLCSFELIRIELLHIDEQVCLLMPTRSDDRHRVRRVVTVHPHPVAQLLPRMMWFISPYALFSRFLVFLFPGVLCPVP